VVALTLGNRSSPVGLVGIHLGAATTAAATATVRSLTSGSVSLTTFALYRGTIPAALPALSILFFLTQTADVFVKGSASGFFRGHSLELVALK
jgi:hypothetical protein